MLLLREDVLVLTFMTKLEFFRCSCAARESRRKIGPTKKAGRKQVDETRTHRERKLSIG